MLSSLRASRMAWLAALALGMGTAPGILTQPTIVQSAPRVARSTKRNAFPAIASPHRLYGTKGAGISMAQQKRTAAKKRGIARNRRNHR